jgi:hypothetical protein
VIASLNQQLTRLSRLGSALLGDVNIRPSAEAVFEVPLGLAVANQDKLVHEVRFDKRARREW